MRRAVKVGILSVVGACTFLGSAYWYFRVLPIVRAEKTPLSEIFLDRSRFNKIEMDELSLRLRAIGNDWYDKLPKGVDCNNPKYNQTERKLITSIAYNNQVKRVRSAEAAAEKFDDNRQPELTDQAEAEAVRRFKTAEILRKEIECYDLAVERRNPSY